MSLLAHHGLLLGQSNVVDTFTVANLPLSANISDATGRSWSMLVGSQRFSDGAFDFTGSEVVSAADSSDFAFGVGDFYVGGYFVRTRAVAEERLVSMRWATPTPGVNATYGNVLSFLSGKLSWSDGTAWASSANDVPQDTRVLCEAMRIEGVLTLRIAGNVEFSGARTVNISGNRPCRVGGRDAAEGSSVRFHGLLDGLIIRKGIGKRYGS